MFTVHTHIFMCVCVCLCPCVRVHELLPTKVHWSLSPEGMEQSLKVKQMLEGWVSTRGSRKKHHKRVGQSLEVCLYAFVCMHMSVCLVLI